MISRYSEAITFDYAILERMNSVDARFWAKVNKEGPTLIEELGPCWVWTGNTRTGYGMIRDSWNKSRKMFSAHRLSWAWANGIEYPDRYVIVRHRCDNPPCVRPEHLESGTFRDNNHDTMQRDRMSHTVLTNALVAEARNRARTGESVHQIIKDMPEGTTATALIMAVRGQTFPYAASEPVPNPSLFRKQYVKLSDEAYLEIYEALKTPWRGQGLFLAKKYGVDKSLISKIKNGAFYPASLLE